MKQNLSLIRETIEGADSDPNKSLFFYNNPRARASFIMDIIQFSAHHVDGIHDPVAMQLRTSEILQWLDIHFQQYAWPAHEVHFHTSFMEQASCPYTCLNEISTIIEKLIKDKFAA